MVGNFRDRYRETAVKTDPGFLISALNILNEAEIQYRVARNKRLQVELTLIRLSYLTQALHLSAGGEIKKGVATARPVAFRTVPPMEVRRTGDRGQENGAAKLEIEEMPAAGRTPQGEEPVNAPVTGHRLPVTDSGPAAGDKSPSLSALSKIRQQVQSRRQQDETDPSRPLEEKLLRSSWDSITDTLKKNKNPAAHSFGLAELVITGPQTFEVLTNNNLEQRFVEQEKRSVSELLQSVFNNRTIAFAISVREGAAPVEMAERTLSKREQFQLIAEQYPLLKELKDRLRLELDY